MKLRESISVKYCFYNPNSKCGGYWVNNKSCGYRIWFDEDKIFFI